MPFPRILVVEDYEPFRQFVCLSLQHRAEWQVIQASNGLEAVRKARELQPDLVLIDISLPELSGIEAAKRIRKLAPHAKLLFISQESDPDIVGETFRLGARGYVHKLLALNDLLPAIEAVLGGKRFVSSGLEFNNGADAHHRHEIQFYCDDSTFLKGSTRFIADALLTADAAIVVATKSHREALVQRLKAEGFDMDGAIDQRTYISLDAADTLSTIMVNGMPDVVRFSEGLRGLIASVAKVAEAEHPRVAIFGECAGLLCAEENFNAAISLEKLGNDLIKTYNVDILCPYPLLHGQENDTALKSVCAEHTTVYWR
jgi:DNA-binding NarL/FixJ family response regulator